MKSASSFRKWGGFGEEGDHDQAMKQAGLMECVHHDIPLKCSRIGFTPPAYALLANATHKVEIPAMPTIRLFRHNGCFNT